MYLKALEEKELGETSTGKCSLSKKTSTEKYPAGEGNPNRNANIWECTKFTAITSAKGDKLQPNAGCYLLTASLAATRTICQQMDNWSLLTLLHTQGCLGNLQGKKAKTGTGKVKN